MYSLVSFAAVPFFGFSKKKKPLKTQNSREKPSFAGAETHLVLRSPVFGEKSVFFLCWNFNGMGEIAGGFTSKVEKWKSSKIVLKSGMRRKAPKRESRNPFNYKLK